VTLKVKKKDRACDRACHGLQTGRKSITFASRSKKYDVTEASIANKFVILDFYVAVLCKLSVTICGSYSKAAQRAGLATPGV